MHVTSRVVALTSMLPSVASPTSAPLPSTSNHELTLTTPRTPYMSALQTLCKVDGTVLLLGSGIVWGVYR